ncbi:MAG: hypothetical protein DMG57_00080 [Acidobacteria bacterium]|nr:MAG: hypothetical protein DMG57_00080 [Acidobacteriota bacterium]
MHVVAHALHCGNVGENAVLRAHLAKEWLRKQVCIPVGKGIEDPPRKARAKQHQLFRLLHRKLSQQERVHNAEDGSVGADPESK